MISRKKNVLLSFSVLLLLIGCLRIDELYTRKKLFAPLSHFHEYHLCKKGDARACYLLSEWIALKQIQLKLTKQERRKAVSQMLFYLRRSCSMKNSNACAVLGLWIAHSGQPCSLVEKAFGKSCVERSWQGCLLLSFPGWDKSSALTGASFQLLEESKCFPGKKGFLKNLKKAVCTFTKGHHGAHSSGILCKDGHVLSGGGILSSKLDDWFCSDNPIFRLISRKRKFKNFY